MYTCKQIRDIVKGRLRHEMKSECIQDADYFDLIKRGIKRCHRLLTGVNSYYYRKMNDDYHVNTSLTGIEAFPADLYKVIGWVANPTEFAPSLLGGTPDIGDWGVFHWCEAAEEDGTKGLRAINTDNGTQSMGGVLTYIREPDMPTNWASAPDMPDGYDDWLLQYVLAESMAIASQNPGLDISKLQELDSMVMNMNSRGGAAGQVAAS